MDEQFNDKYQNERHQGGWGGRVLMGVLLLGIGGVLLMKQLGFYFPDWLFNWHLLLIVFGFFIGIQHRFRGGGWMVMILVGSFFLLQDIFPEVTIKRYFWPAALIGLGLLIIARPHQSPGWRRRRGPKDDWREERKRLRREKWSNYYSPAGGQGNYTSEDLLDSTAIFGAVHKKIVSKNFRGGDVTSMLGGTELDLTQADIQGTVILDVTQIMGGTKIIVPAHWEVRSEVTAVFGGFEDKRQQPAITNPDKILILRGTSVFGGIELRNF